MRPLLALALLCLLITAGCQSPLAALVGAEEEVSLRHYRDSALGLDMGFPEGWSFTEKKETTASGPIHSLFFEPISAAWTRRFTVRLQIPDRRDTGRSLEDFRNEFMERLGRSDNIRLQDTAWTSLSGERAFRAQYAVRMNGTDYTRHIEFLSLPEGQDVSLSFEVDAKHAGPDIVVYKAVAERFRYTPR